MINYDHLFLERIHEIRDYSFDGPVFESFNRSHQSTMINESVIYSLSLKIGMLPKDLIIAI